MKKKYEIIFYPEHLVYYTPKTLSTLCEKFGLRGKKILTSGISISKMRYRAPPKGEIIKSNVLKEDEVLRKFTERSYLKFIKNLTNQLLNLTGTGATIKAYFEKE